MRAIAVIVSLLVWTTATAGHVHRAGDLHVTAPWSRALPPVSETGAAYLTVENRGGSRDRLLSVTTPLADGAEIHTQRSDQGVMKMRRLDYLDIEAGERVRFEPGALHIMLLGLQRPLVAGESYPLTLGFERAGDVDVEVVVLEAGAGAPESHGHGERAGGRIRGAAGSVPVNPANAPSVRVSAAADSRAGWNVHVQTGGFRFAPEHAGGAHVAGEGHARLYIDGDPVARLYGPWYHLARRLSPGEHRLSVALFANNHAPLSVDGEPVRADTVIEAAARRDKAGHSADARIFVLNFRDGRVIGVDTGTIRVSLGDRVELHWAADTRVELYLHGYDLTARSAPGAPGVMRFEASMPGSFPVEIQGEPAREVLLVEVHAQ